jgi:uncharacterized protein YkwD
MRTLLCTLAFFLAGVFAAPVQAQAQAAEGFGRHLADLINRYREHQGLAPLAIAQDLAALAGEHSAGMAARRQLTHDGFHQRHLRARSRVCVENVGWNFKTAEALLEGWRHSEGHHRNLLETQVSRMGIAVDARYVTFFACL